MIVEEVGGLDKIEQLQSHENEQVYSSALHIIETFFVNDQDEDNSIAPSTLAANNDGSAYQFATAAAAPAGGFNF